MPVFIGEVNPDGRGERIGLMRLQGMDRTTVQTLDEAALVLLPDGGSLGQRATMFDWHAVFGVHPTDREFIIAPDIVASNVKVTRDGGLTWTVDEQLTRLVLQNGELPMFAGSVYFMQVTHISFDTYRPDRILIGTRDAGIICSSDRGASWRVIPDSQRISYVTGFHFKPEGLVYASSYGRGLWVLFAGEDTCANAAFAQPSVARSTILSDQLRSPGSPGDGVPTGRTRVPARPGGPLLWLRSSLPPTGMPVVGTDTTIWLRGERLTEHAGKRLAVILDGETPVGEVVPDASGTFSLRAALPTSIAKGVHRLQVLSYTMPNRPVVLIDFAKITLDEHLGKPERHLGPSAKRFPDEIVK